MLKPGMTKTEIEKDIQGKGNFVQIDHLTRFLREPVAMETKKFIFLKLAELYESARILPDAAKMYDNAADLSIAYTEKIKYYLKEAETFSKLGAFDRVDIAMKKALSEANIREKEDIMFSIKQFYKTQAMVCEKEAKRNQAAKFYEKLLELRITDQERKEIKEKLMNLYKALGKVREAANIEKALESQ